MIPTNPLLFQHHFPPHALIRCDGSSELGMGHVVRCLALADILLEKYGWQVSFVMRQEPLGVNQVQKRGYVVHFLHQGGEAVDSPCLANFVSRVPGDVLICDVRDDLHKNELHEVRKKGILIALLDDLTERRFAADMVFYPPIPQLDQLDWTGYTGQKYVGWEWVVLRRDVRDAKRTTASKRPLIVVTMGASDPSGFTMKAIQAMELVQHDVDVIVVLGSGFCHGLKFAEQAALLHRTFDVRSNVTNLPDLLVNADLVVGAFGTTAYELGVMGVPSIFLCATADHAESSRALMNAGFGISLGLGSDVNEKTLAKIIEQEIAKQAVGKLPNTGTRSDPVIDGFGAERVAEQIVMVVQEQQRSHEAVAVS